MSADEQLPEVALAVTTEVAAPTVAVVRAAGDVDTITAPQLRGAIDEQTREGIPHVVLDLSGVVFLGSAGLALLVEQREAALARDGALRLAAVPRAVARPLSLTGLAELFDTYDDVPAAVADLRDDAHG